MSSLKLLPDVDHLVGSADAGFVNMAEGQRPSADTDPKGGRPWEGSKEPGLLNTLVVFFLFFHLALLF